VLGLMPNAPTFGIYAIPSVTAPSPAFGPMAGGTAVTITGTAFVSGVTTVKFGANAAATNTGLRSVLQIERSHASRRGAPIPRPR
jgi:hypothetical protein